MLVLTDALGSDGPQLGPSLARCHLRWLNETRFGKAEQKIYSLIKERRRKGLCSKDPFSPKGRKLGDFPGIKGRCTIRNWGKGWRFPGTARSFTAPQAPLHTALVVPSKAQVPSSGGDLSVKQRQLSGTCRFPLRRRCPCS